MGAEVLDRESGCNLQDGGDLREHCDYIRTCKYWTVNAPNWKAGLRGWGARKSRLSEMPPPPITPPKEDPFILSTSLYLEKNLFSIILG